MIKSLQSFRFIFALMIFAHHYFIPQIEPFGAFPVSFFFILSGYVMTLGHGDKVDCCEFNYISFLKKRLIRLFPLNMICLLLIMLLPTLMDAISGSLHIARYRYVLVDALLLQSWIPMKSVYYSGNPVAWFLSDILFFYLLFPPLVKAIKRVNLKILLSSIFVAYFIIVQLVPNSWVHPLLYVNPLLRLTDFVIGIALAFLLKPSFKFHQDNTLLQIVSLCIAIVSLVIYPHIPLSYSIASLYWIPSIFLIVSFSWGGQVSKILESRALVYLGSLSFPFYMMHLTVILWWRAVEGHLPFKNQVVGAFICVGLIIIMSYLYTKLLEPYFIKKLK